MEIVINIDLLFSISSFILSIISLCYSVAVYKRVASKRDILELKSMITSVEIIAKKAHKKAKIKNYFIPL
jgi:hypothetical protein